MLSGTLFQSPDDAEEIIMPSFSLGTFMLPKLVTLGNIAKFWGHIQMAFDPRDDRAEASECWLWVNIKLFSRSREPRCLASFLWNHLHFKNLEPWRVQVCHWGVFPVFQGQNTSVLFVNYIIILEDVASILNHSYFFPLRNYVNFYSSAIVGGPFSYELAQE